MPRIACSACLALAAALVSTAGAADGAAARSATPDPATAAEPATAPATRPATAPATEPATAPRTTTLQQQLRDAYVARRWPEVETAATELLARLAASGDGESTVAGDALVALGDARLARREVDGAAAAYRQAVEVYTVADGPASGAAVVPLVRLADLARGANDARGEADLLTRAVAHLRRSEGLNSRSAEPLQARLVPALLAAGDPAAAEREALQMLRTAELRVGDDSTALVPTLEFVANAYLRAGAGGKARPHFERAVAIIDRGGVADDPRLLRPLTGIAQSYVLIYRLAAEDARSVGATSVRSVREDRFGAPSCVTNPRTGAQVCENIPVAFDGSAADRRLAADGEPPLLRAVQIARRRTELAAWERGTVLLQAGDWFLLKGDVGRAHAFHAEAWPLLEEPVGRPLGASNPLLAVRPLLYRPPAGTAAFRDLPESQVRVRYVVTAFTVRADGRTQDVRPVEKDASLATVDECRAAVRAAVYAPRYVDGAPVETPDVTVRELFRVRR